MDVAMHNSWLEKRITAWGGTLDIRNMFVQSISLYKSAHHVEEYEQKNNVRFDWVIRFRSDLMLLGNIVHLSQAVFAKFDPQTSDDAIWVNGRASFNGFGDQFFMGPRNVVLRTMTGGVEMMTEQRRPEFRDLMPELILRLSIARTNVTTVYEVDIPAFLCLTLNLDGTCKSPSDEEKTYVECIANVKEVVESSSCRHAGGDFYPSTRTIACKYNSCSSKGW
eukprot:CAMPEP_0196578808 /NCGR_PEP_ID=MMETSP1081-20130531/7634_1 /TAXON_ID=36882 /ORGANISM="Pyramimonas amylifera, Strain CCMP720" /LENGTH=221 /DNA_ID=CAMNT_0041898137 /DNA_START=661 /DNA_END=1323 /DNA_ORIENTATION=+